MGVEPKWYPTTSEGALSYLGFGPAPKYAEASALQNRIGHLYREHVAPGARPYQEEANTHERQVTRNNLLLVQQSGDTDRIKAPYIRSTLQGEQGDQRMFKQLPQTDQMSLLNRATPAEFARYFPRYAKTRNILRLSMRNKVPKTAPQAPLPRPATRSPAPRGCTKIPALRLTGRAPMPNGAAVAHLPLPKPLEVAAPEPEIETTIGEAVADAAVAVALGMETYRCHGALARAGKKAGAEALAALAQLQLDNLEISDFAAVALVEGRRVLNQRHGATLMRQLNLDAAALDRTLDFFIARDCRQGDRRRTAVAQGLVALNGGPGGPFCQSGNLDHPSRCAHG